MDPRKPTQTLTERRRKRTDRFNEQPTALSRANRRGCGLMSPRQMIVCAVFLSLFIFLLNPLSESGSAEALKLKKKEKKVLKSLVKGLLVKKLTTKKNFMPLPVPIPVPIEVTEQPVYLKGKPQYVTIYKPAPVVKPTTVYHMPVYSPTYEYMMDPYSMYGSMMMANKMGSPYSSMKHSASGSSSDSAINFTDYDDESGNYYMRKTPGNGNSNFRRMRSSVYVNKRLDSPILKLRTVVDREEINSDDQTIQTKRVKRQVYQSGYEYEPPCYGFPLEVNIRSRIKFDQLFPIRGQSQHKKCIKRIIPSTMIMQQQQTPSQPPLTQSNEELCNLLIQSLVAKDEKLMQKVLEQEDATVIKDVVNRIPVNHVRKLVIELSNLLSIKLSVNHLQWLQHILAHKYSVISSMADGRSILLPLISLLEDRSSPAYFNKMQALKGKLLLLNQLREARKSDTAQKVVNVQVEQEQSAVMEVESESDTNSEEDFDDGNVEEDEGGELSEGDGIKIEEDESAENEEEPCSPENAQSDEDL